MVFDMTDYESTLKSLLICLDLSKEDKENVLDFIYLESTDVEEFLESFEIEDKCLLEKDIELVSLHSTTNIDKCQFIKEIGLVNLQDAVSIDTPLKNYLNEKDINISIESKCLMYKGKKFDISEQTQGYSLTDEEKHRNDVIHKLYKDFQINGFLCHSNIVSYGGYTRNRPEILLNLSRFLNDNKIESDWVEQENREHYIIKFKQPLNCYKYWTFLAQYEDSYFGITKDNLEYLPSEAIELRVKRWLIQKAIYILKEGVYELFSYVHPNIRVEPKDIIEILTEQQYLDKYRIEYNH